MDKAALLEALERIDRIGIVFCIVAAIGAVGLAYVAVDHWRRGGELQRIEAAEAFAQEKAISEAKAQASAANARTTEAERDIEALRTEAANANARANEARSTAEHERLEREKLEAKMAPRSLDADQLAALATRLRPYAGQRVFVFLTALPEPLTIGNQLSRAMLAGGWALKVASGAETSRAVSGVLVELREEADGQSIAAAKALVEAISAAGLTVHGPIPQQAGAGAGVSSGMPDPMAMIRMTVGVK